MVGGIFPKIFVRPKNFLPILNFNERLHLLCFDFVRLSAKLAAMHFSRFGDGDDDNHGDDDDNNLSRYLSFQTQLTRRKLDEKNCLDEVGRKLEWPNEHYWV